MVARFIVTSPPEEPDWLLDNQELFCYKEQIYIPDINNLQLEMLRANHDHILAGHPGHNKTILLIQRSYTWPNLWKFVKNYVVSCNVCLPNKP